MKRTAAVLLTVTAFVLGAVTLPAQAATAGGCYTLTGFRNPNVPWDPTHPAVMRFPECRTLAAATAAAAAYDITYPDYTFRVVKRVNG